MMVEFTHHQLLILAGRLAWWVLTRWFEQNSAGNHCCMCKAHLETSHDKRLCLDCWAGFTRLFGREPRRRRTGRQRSTH